MSRRKWMFPALLRASFVSRPSPFLALLSLLLAGVTTRAQPPMDPCEMPPGVSAVAHARFPASKIIAVSDLSADDRNLYEKKHPGACPGLASVNFYGDHKPTLALALASKRKNDLLTRLVIAHLEEGKWTLTVLTKTNGPAPVLWAEPPGEYKDLYGVKKIRATNPVVVFCGYYSWAVVYAWINNRVSTIWLQD
ncbi:MAG TPA: hypothetical protein VMJ93_03990 [Verrucomicrobiae bacterium]|nr:hypothetical protein [Verrucomicrobiae bacterium]